MKKILLAAAFVGLVAARGASAVEYHAVQPDKSQITFVSKQMGVPIDGRFNKFNAQIIFDPAKPEAGKAQVDLDLNSIDAGSDEATTEVKRKDWFDTGRFPTARFASEGVKPLGNGRYQATGKMTIKGRTQPVVVPFTFTTQGNTGLFDGTLAIKRLQFGVGEGPWGDTSTVADEVVIKFKFSVAAQAAPRK